jgi:CubicO group peptidase (beta-lactamase class C family)
MADQAFSQATFRGIPAAWEDHNQLRQEVCDFTLEWEPGARVMYHSAAAHWVQAVLSEAVTGPDYRQYIRDTVTQPLGLVGLWVGVPDTLHDLLVGAYERTESGEPVALAERNTPAFWRAGVPGGGGYASAAALTAFYQMATVAPGRLTPGLTPRQASLLPICPIRSCPNPTTAAVWTKS